MVFFKYCSVDGRDLEIVKDYFIYLEAQLYLSVVNNPILHVDPVYCRLTHVAMVGGGGIGRRNIKKLTLYM